ncbi:MAG: beta-galactosidase [Chitinophagaceae bacterium]|nr:beta-galactosidase [Chitinophagaceae bacterium]
MKHIFIFLFFTTLSFSQTIERKPIKVEVKVINGQFKLYRDGKPYFIKGAAGHTHLEQLAKYGGNSIRTWGLEGTEELLNEAHRLGLTVTFGLWVQHERHGFNYNNEEKVAVQLERFTETVKQFKDHPALLAWGIGNEVDLQYTNTNVWDAINDIAKMIHREDPNHPTLTVTAGIDEAEIKLIKTKCPEIDIYAVNAYGDLPNIPTKIRTFGWTGPYIVTEWGFTGHWEIAKTNWDVAIEETSTEKARVYQSRYEKTIAIDTARCLGSYVFLWGNKIEYTPTWCGLFLASGEETETVGVMDYLWSGKWPTNKAPQVSGITIDRFPPKKSIVLEPNSLHRIAAPATDPDSDPLMYEWVLLYESNNKLVGGDAEKKPGEIKGHITSDQQGTATIIAPAIVGAYRVYVYIYDGQNHAATANFPFYVESE